VIEQLTHFKLLIVISEVPSYIKEFTEGANLNLVADDFVDKLIESGELKRALTVLSQTEKERSYKVKICALSYPILIIIYCVIEQLTHFKLLIVISEFF